MDQTEIFAILNKRVFNEEKPYLVKNIVANPERFVGVFRSTTPRLKLIQNLLQSREIRFGDALEEIIEKLLVDMGFIAFPREIQVSKSKKMSLDQYFSDSRQSHYYLIEQKVRDDHDSSKKRGQVDNFRAKLEFLKRHHGSALTGIMYFIDPSLTKNKKHYMYELKSLSNTLDIPLYLFYNGELFEHLGDRSVWDTLSNALIIWRDTVPQEINLDCDVDFATSLHELRVLEAVVWYKLALNDALWENGVVQCIFSTGTTLEQLSHEFEQRSTEQFKMSRLKVTFGELASKLRHRLSSHY